MRTMFILALLCGLSLASFAQKKAHKDSPQVTIAKDLVNSFNSGDYTHAWSLYDASIKKLLSADQIKKTWEDLEIRNGKFQRFSKTTSDVQNGVEVVYTLCHFEKGKVKLKTTFNNENEVTSFLVLREDEDK